MQLRPNQRKLIADIRHHFSHGSVAPIAVAPTGMGKTVCLSYMADGASRKENRVGVIVHRQELVTQTSMALAKMGVYHGIVAPPAVIRAAIAKQIEELGRSYFNSDAEVQVCSIQTLVRRLDTIKLFDFLMIDEAHHAAAGQWAKLIAAMPKAKILGVTATPQRLDGKGLGVQFGGCFTSLVLGPTVQELIDLGNLAQPRIFAPPMQFDMQGIKTRGGDFDNRTSTDKIDKPTITGDAISHYQRLCDGIPAIAFCASVKHAQHVAEQFQEAGYSSICVEGNMDDKLRRQAINGLGTGRYNVVTSCDIISEGTDIPIVGAAIMLRPTQSLSLYLQQGGRVLRPYKDKDYAIILDHVGNSTRHGLLEDDREWSLEGRKKKSKKSDETEVGVRQCMKCYMTYSANASACPACGIIADKQHRTIEQTEGELVEIKKAAQIKKNYEQAAATSLEQLIEVGRSRGMDNPRGWAKHVLQARQRKRRA